LAAKELRFRKKTGHNVAAAVAVDGNYRVVSNNEMPWLVPLCLWLALVALVVAAFVFAVRNARALRRDVRERRDTAQARLESQATALVDELFARSPDKTE
jgi:hypothetical protein